MDANELLQAFDDGESAYWLLEEFALEVRCNQGEISRLRARVAELESERVSPAL